MKEKYADWFEQTKIDSQCKASKFSEQLTTHLTQIEMVNRLFGFMQWRSVRRMQT